MKATAGELRGPGSRAKAAAEKLRTQDGQEGGDRTAPEDGQEGGDGTAPEDDLRRIGTPPVSAGSPEQEYWDREQELEGPPAGQV